MNKKNISLVVVLCLIFTIAIAPLAFAEMSSEPPTEMKQAKALYGTPVVDGEIDEIWGYAHRFAGKEGSWQGLVPSEAFSDTRIMWDEDAFYILAEITDPHVGGLHPAELYKNDSLEFYVDQLNKKLFQEFEVDNSFRINVDYKGDVVVDDAKGPYGGELTSFAVETDYGYLVEASVTWVGDFEPTVDHVIGFELQINDNSLGGFERTGVTSWYNPQLQAWRDPSAFGEAILTSADDKAEPSERPGHGDAGDMTDDDMTDDDATDDDATDDDATDDDATDDDATDDDMTDDDATDDDMTDDDATDDEDGTNPLVFIIPIVAVVAIAAYFILKGKK